MAHALLVAAVDRVTDREVNLGESVRAVAAGDRDAFSRLYADYSRMVHALLLGRVPRLDVDDLVQDVFLTAFTRIRELREPAAFGGWIATIARHGARSNAARSVPTPHADQIGICTMAILQIPCAGVRGCGGDHCNGRRHMADGAKYAVMGSNPYGGTAEDRNRSTR